MLRANGQALLPSIAIGIGIVVLSHGVNIAVHKNWAAYRTLGALATCILILLVYGIRALLPTTLRAPLWRAIVLAAVAVQALSVRWNIAPHVVIAPQQEELRILRARVSAFVERQSPAIVFKMPSWSDNHAHLYRYDEIGAPSSSVPWVPDPAVRLIYRELTGKPFLGEVEVVDASGNSHGQMTRSDAFVIDMKAEYAAARK